MKKHLIFILINLCLNNFVSAQILFSPQEHFSMLPLYIDFRQTAIGDLNNDGLNDVVVLSEGYSDPTESNIYVYTQDTAGYLREPQIYSYAKSYLFGAEVSINDFNNDNLMDIVVVYNDSIRFFYQNILYGFNMQNSTKFDYSVGWYSSMISGDLNNDNLIDIAIATAIEDSLCVLYQQQDGIFKNKKYTKHSAGMLELDILDINNDNLNDLVLLADGINIYTQNTNGKFNEYVNFPTINNFENAFAFGDLNNDNLIDIAIVKDTYNLIYIYLQNEDNTFSLSWTSKYITGASNLEIADFNCDNKNDIAIIRDDGGFSVLENKGNLDFDLHDYGTPFIGGTNSYDDKSVSVGDINNDGKVDVVNANSESGFYVFYNKSNPVTPQIIGKTAICEDNATNVYQTSFEFTGTLTWNLQPTEAGTIINTTNNSCEIAWNNNFRGNAELFATGTNNCGISNSDTLNITISRLPKLDLGSDKILCTNSELFLHASTEFTSYKWNDNSTDTTLLVKVGGEYFVEAQHICGIAYDTVKVIEKQPQINLPSDTLLCKGSDILFDVSLAGNNQYLWQNGIPTPFISVENAGVYSVTITDEYNCKNEKTVVVSEINPPIWKLPIDTSFCAGDILILDAFCNDCFYSWQDSIDIQEFEITKTGIYNLKVYNFCDTISKSINATALDCDTYFAVPSAFSPNNDNNNDELFAVGKNIENINFKIFDRWGNIVFETTDINKGWDGTYKGKKLDTNVFMYFATAKSVIDGKTVQTQGNVSLIR